MKTLPRTRQVPTLTMTHWVPPESTEIVGRAYVTTTAKGTRIAWDTCGRCGIHVLHCTCTGAHAPRSVTYIWHQDRAHSRGEEWSPEHPDYRKEFEAQKIAPPRRKYKRMRR